MSGKKQHYIWKHIQNGFSTPCERRNKNMNIIIYDICGNIRQGITKNSGVENKFYGPEGSIADNIITQKENSLSAFVFESRGKNNGDYINQEQAALLVTLTELRGKSTRHLYEKIGITISESILNEINNNDFIYNIINYKLKKVFNDLHNGDVNENVLSIMSYLFKNKENIIYDITSCVENFLKNIPLKARENHNNSLENENNYSSRLKDNLNYNFYIRKSSTVPFILPDTGICVFSGDQVFPMSSFFINGDVVIMPISENSCIIGEKLNSPISAKSISDEKIIYSLSSVSNQFFIAKEKLSLYQDAARKISSNFRLANNEDISLLALKIMKDENFIYSLSEHIRVPYKGIII